MEIIMIIKDDVEIADIEQAFKDHRARAKEYNHKFYLTAESFPVSNCRTNDKHIILIQKEKLNET